MTLLANAPLDNILGPLARFVVDVVRLLTWVWEQPGGKVIVVGVLGLSALFIICYWGVRRRSS